jgi:DNA-binding LacI/PurR family transcriptional regulator
LNKTPTIHDLAADLKVSATTVWRALNDRPRVSDKTRARVIDRANALRYVPSLVAQNLSHGRTRTLGVIVPMIGHPVFSSLLEEIEAAAFDRGYNVILCDARLDLAREAEYARRLLQRRVEGVIVVPFSKRSRDWDSHLIDLQQAHVPVVLLEHELPSNRFSRVVADNLNAALQMTRHLIRLGHQRIAFAFHPGHERDFVGRDRLEGFKRAMAEAGLTGQSTLLLEACDFGPRQILHYHREVIAGCFSSVHRPTALFAGMDMLAIRALETLRELGLRVPQDVAVAGFDNLEFSRFTQPPLTTVEQPTQEMGRLAAEIVFERIDGKNASPKKAVCARLPCRLIVRESCGGHPPPPDPP